MRDGLRAVEVIWRDSNGREGWLRRDEAYALTIGRDLHTLGFILRDTPQELVICETVPEESEDGVRNYGHVFAIPRVAVQSVTELKGVGAMPVRIRSVGRGKVSVATPGGTKAKATTPAKARRQANLLRAVEHNPNWRPTGKKARR